YLHDQIDRVLLVEQVQLLVGRREVRQETEQEAECEDEDRTATAEPEIAQLLSRHHEPAGCGRRVRRSCADRDVGAGGHGCPSPVSVRNASLRRPPWNSQERIGTSASTRAPMAL